MNKRHFLQALAATAAATVLPGAQAQGVFPNRPVRIIVPFPPGALTDSLARMLGAKLQDQWQQTVVVENRAGASGNIGTEFVFRAPADGYTLLFTPHSTLTLSKLITPQISFDPELMTPVSMVTRSTVLMLANPRLPARNLQELIAYGRANPGKLNFASTGVGTTAHLANELFFTLSKVNGVSVPYQGVAPATNALLAGDVDVLFDAMANSLPNIKAGKLRALAVAGDTRSPALPEVESTSETLPDFVAPLWTALAGPPKLPAELASKIAIDVAKALKHPDFVARFNSTPGLEAIGNKPEEVQAAIKRERELWPPFLKTNSSKGE